MVLYCENEHMFFKRIFVILFKTYVWKIERYKILVFAKVYILYTFDIYDPKDIYILYWKFYIIEVLMWKCLYLDNLLKIVSEKQWSVNHCGILHHRTGHIFTKIDLYPFPEILWCHAIYLQNDSGNLHLDPFSTR